MPTLFVMPGKRSLTASLASYASPMLVAIITQPVVQN